MSPFKVSFFDAIQIACQITNPFLSWDLMKSDILLNLQYNLLNY